VVVVISEKVAKGELQEASIGKNGYLVTVSRKLNSDMRIISSVTVIRTGRT